MSKVSVAEQTQLGTDLARLVEPLPSDQRLMLLAAGLYGEARSQGLTGAEAVAFFERMASIHDQGVLVQNVRAIVCPLCGQRPAAVRQ